MGKPLRRPIELATGSGAMITKVRLPIVPSEEPSLTQVSIALGRTAHRLFYRTDKAPCGRSKEMPGSGLDCADREKRVLWVAFSRERVSFRREDGMRILIG